MAGLAELNSFVTKFLNLWQSGCDASLQLKTRGGKAKITLQLGLGEAPPPPFSTPPPRRVPGPSRQRRTERRALARKEAEEAEDKTNVEEEENVEEAENAKQEAEEASDVTAAGKACEASEVSAEQVRTIFPCLICDFVSNWESGLLIHMTKKHSMIEQLDGNADLPEDDNFADTAHYWKTGRLGTAFQTFLDANSIIDNSNFPAEIKDTEKLQVCASLESEAVIFFLWLVFIRTRLLQSGNGFSSKT
jgi:hypothetical protein